MGNMSSAAEKASNVARDKAAVAACKASLGLDPNACYPLPPAYKGQCDYLELELKKSMAYAVDPTNAAILYDPNSSRKAKVQANQVTNRVQAFLPLIRRSSRYQKLAFLSRFIFKIVKY
jgi:hypothetical protein